AYFAPSRRHSLRFLFRERDRFLFREWVGLDTISFILVPRLSIIASSSHDSYHSRLLLFWPWSTEHGACTVLRLCLAPCLAAPRNTYRTLPVHARTLLSFFTVWYPICLQVISPPRRPGKRGWTRTRPRPRTRDFLFHSWIGRRDSLHGC
ncbi:hypothetical protein B0H14DRAFT_2771097, partial [Mycena olivaceomarginata]